MSIGALIVAHGMVSNGEILNPTEIIGSVSVVTRMAETFRQINADRIVVVYSAERFPELTKQAAKMGALCLDCGKAFAEMFDCVKIGADYLQNKCDRMFLASVDTPFFTAETLNTLLLSKEMIVNPVFMGEIGHPLLLDKQIVGELMEYKGGGGLRGFLEGTKHERGFAKVKDSGVICNRKTASDVESVAQECAKKNLHVSVNLQLVNERPFFGRTGAQLLGLIEETESVSLACRQMGISYSKGWKILGIMEEETGRKLVMRQQGGKNGGAACLTKDGQELLNRFEIFEKLCNTYIKKEFDELFSHWQKGKQWE
ncbi:MAG: NTP transferase domain-containing protein [Oscillospiraceae bacterium]